MSSLYAMTDMERQTADPPSEDEARKVAEVLRHYENGVRVRQRWSGRWKKAWEYSIAASQWGQRPSWKASPVENYIHSKVQHLLAMLTDNRPKIHVLPREPEYKDYSDDLQKLLDYLWYRQRMDTKIVEALNYAVHFGLGFLYPYWDYDTDEICTEVVSPYNLVVDEDATCIEDARYVGHVTRMSRDEILSRWPDAEGKFRPGTRTVADPREQEGFDPATGRVPSDVGYAYEDDSVAAGTLAPYVSAEMDGHMDEDDMVQVLQFWIRDHELVRKPMMTKGGPVLDRNGDEVYTEEPRYPGGRHIIVAGNRVIHEGANPFLHRRTPYVEVGCYKIPGEFWHISFVHNLISPQKELNKTLGLILDSKNRMGAPQWLGDTNNGVTAEMLTGEPGLYIRKNPGTVLERLDPPPLPSYVINYLQLVKQAIDEISGVPDVSQGMKPSGISAGVAIESLQEAANTRNRLLVRNVENAIAELGEMWVSLAQQFYREPRTIRVTDQETGEFSFRTLQPEALAAQWEVFVAAGSTLPRNRDARQRQGAELLKMGVIDNEALLEYVEWPGKEKVLKKVREMQRMQMDLAMQGVDQGAGVNGAG